MKKFTVIVAALLVAFLFTASTALAEEIAYSGFLGDQNVYKTLQPGPEGGVKMRWLAPGTDFKKYGKVMVDSVIFFLSNKAENKAIDPEVMKELADNFNKAFVEALKDKYPIVSEPGPDVVRIRVALTNLEPSNPVSGTLSSIVPIGIGVSLIKKGATGEWAGGGRTTMEFQALDSSSGAVIAMGYDQQTAGYGDRFSKWGSSNEAFKFWAGRLVTSMDVARGIKK